MTDTLHLPVIDEYFQAMKNGTKLFEYRKRTPFWDRRIKGRTYKWVKLTSGYPKRGDTEKTLVVPWRGYAEQTITHPHFGNVPTDVYAIRIMK